MSNAEKIADMVRQIEARTQEIFVGTVVEAQRSIVEGSEITSAPGQPVDTGFLKGSWQLTFPSTTKATISTNVAYAPVIEEGVRSKFNINGRQRPLVSEGGPRSNGPSLVGGQHSVKLTINGLQRIVDIVTKRGRA